MIIVLIIFILKIKIAKFRSPCFHASLQVLKNPEREKSIPEKEHLPPPKSKDYFVSSKFIKEKDRPKKEWERIRPKERPKIIEKTNFVSRDKDRSRRDKTDYK